MNKRIEEIKSRHLNCDGIPGSISSCEAILHNGEDIVFLLSELEARDKRIEELTNSVEENWGEWAKKCRVFECKNEALREAIVNALIGGNHLALLIGNEHPLKTATHKEALEHYGVGWRYEVWCCWRSLMQLSDALENQSSEPISKCCSASLRVDGDDEEGTMYYVCMSCGKACDAKGGSNV